MNILFGILGSLAFGTMFGVIILNMLMGCQPDIAGSCSWPWQ
jgi:hypothetical protein